MSYNHKQFLFAQLLWIGISFGVSLTISMFLPFPISLVAIFGVFILLNMYMRRAMLRRMSGTAGAGMFSSTSSMFGNNNNSSSLNYYCMGCGTQHRDAACPKCGSKMKKVGF